MNEPIMLSPNDLFNMFMVLCGAIITVSSAITVILNLIKKSREPEHNQDERIKKLEIEVEKINDRLQLDSIRFETDSERVTKLENSMRQTNKVIIEGLQALTAHAIDGNNFEELKEAKKKLDEYLVDRV